MHEVINWAASGFFVKISKCQKTKFVTCGLANEDCFLSHSGVAFSKIGANFNARVHRYPSVFSDAGSSVFPEDLAGAVCAMNSTRARDILSSLNPSVNFQAGDVNRLPLFPIADADAIFARVEAAFAVHEAHREPSVEFRRPGPSPWRAAQAWAQTAVDRPPDAPLPPWVEDLDPEPPGDHLSHALGIALGRFAPAGSDRAAVLDPARDDLSHALPHGLLFLDLTLDAADRRDSLGHPAAAVLHAAWARHGAALAPGRSLRDWLALDAFRDVHRPMYENRPIHWPLSSSGRRFVAWVQIHRMGPQTLKLLLADHLKPTQTRLEGELADLRQARDGADRKAARAADTRFQQLKRALDELLAFIADVEACADAGPPAAAAERGTSRNARPAGARERDARYAPVLDDGVMINAAALWSLLDPQWRDPKKWWQELATPSGRKDYDWAQLAMRYWPRRVDGKCRADPSLAVAHGCFWRYHPARAWAWELRLQDEITADFRLDEAPYQPEGLDLAAADADAARATPAAAALPNPDPGSDAHRAAFLATAPAAAIAAIEREAIRRMGRGQKRRIVAEFRLLDAGLWSRHARTLWDLELALATRQGAELLILAPDAAPARAALLAAHPELAEERRILLASLRPLLPETEDAPEDGEASDTGDGEPDDEEDAAS